MPILYEISAKVGTYKNKSGEEKNAYRKIGVVMETSKGLMAKFETIPVVWDGWAYLNTPEAREDKPQKQRGGSSTVGGKELEDDIPFASCSLSADVIFNRLRWGVE